MAGWWKKIRLKKQVKAVNFVGTYHPPPFWKRVHEGMRCETKPSALCGQRHSRSTKTEIKGLLCGALQVTLKTGGSLFRKSPDLRFFPQSPIWWLLKTKWQQGGLKERYRSKADEMFRPYNADVRPLTSRQPPSHSIYYPSYDTSSEFMSGKFAYFLLILSWPFHWLVAVVLQLFVV